MDEPISRISIEIGASSSKAISEIDKLATALKNLRSSASGKISGFSNLAKQLQDVAQSAHGMEDSVGALAKASKALERLSNLKSISVPKSIGDSIRNIGLAGESVNPQSVQIIDGMTRSLQRLSNVNPEVFRAMGKMQIPEIPAAAGAAITSIAEAAGRVTTDQLANLQQFVASLNGLGDIDLERFLEILQAVGAQMQTIAPSADEAATSTSRLGRILSGLENVAGPIRNVARNLLRIAFLPIRGLATPFKAAAASVSSFSTGLNSAFSGIMRIAKYRIIRAIIKAIGAAFREGVQHLYDWSRAMREANGGDLGRFANSMDDIATSLAYFKNSVGAAVAPLVNMLAPAINSVTNAVIALLNAINQLLARLRGQSSWTRATRNAKEYGDAVSGAGGAAKEALKYLAPFDELNVLPNESSGGGGGGGLDDDVESLFEEMEDFEDGIASFADSIRAAINAENWKELGTILGNKVNEIVNSIDWAGYGTYVGQKINALFTTKYWTLETINFNNIGTKIATFLNNAILKIDFKVIGASIVQKFTILGDLIIGAIEEIDWEQVGESIGAFVRGAFDQAGSWLTSINFYDLGYGLVTKLSRLFAGIDFSSTVESAKRAITAAFNAAGDFFDGVFDHLKDTLGVDLTFGIGDIVFEDKTDWTTKDWLDHIAQAIAPVAGAVIGWLIGGGVGAALGGTIGIALSLLIQSITGPTDESGWNITKWQGSMYTVLFAAGGAAIGLHLGGAKGALLGASLGIAIAMYLQNIDRNIKDNSKWSLDSWLVALKNVIGTVTGTALGFKIGGPGGALFGMTIGLGLDIVLSSFDDEIKNNSGKTFSATDWANKIISLIAPEAGLAAGKAAGLTFSALGGSGALISFCIKNFLSNAQKEADENPVKVPVDYKFSASGGGAYSSGFFGHFRTNTVSYWAASHGGEILNQPVSLKRQGWSTASDWVYQYSGKTVAKPIELKKDGWDTVASWTKQTAQYGEAVDKSITLSSKMDSAYESNKKVSAFMSEWNGLTDKSVTVYVNVAGLSLLDSLLGMLSAVASFFGARFVSAASVSTPRYATGGFPEDGLFMANHGELVGKFSNGRTAVANNDQIISGIERGVYNAVTAAMSNQNNSDREVRVYLDGKEISATTRRYERNINRATGVA